MASEQERGKKRTSEQRGIKGIKGKKEIKKSMYESKRGINETHPDNIIIEKENKIKTHTH